MNKYKVLIADDDPIIRFDEVTILQEAGYEIVGEASDGIEAIRFCEEQRPDIIIMDIKMPLLNGLQASKLIYDKKLCDCILLLTAYSDDKYVEEAVNHGIIMGYILKPFSRQTLLPEVKIALSRAAGIKKLKVEVEQANDAMKQRKLMERAKGILMKKYKCTEEQAYLKLKQTAMNNHCKMHEIAELIISGEKYEKLL